MDSVVHFEIPYDNKERASKFYADTFSWEMQDMPEMNYTIARTGAVDENMMPKEKGFISGGMVERSMAATPVLVINVKEINAAIEKLKENGGQCEMEPQKVGDMGLYVYAKDTEGNIIGVWQNLK